MAAFSGPEIANSGLVLHLDPNSRGVPEGEGLTYWLVDWNGGHPANEAGLDSVFTTSATLRKTGFHEGTLNWAQAPTTWRFPNNGSTTGTTTGYPSYMDTSTYYGILYRGWIYAPEDGLYEFSCDGDDALDVFVNDTKVSHWYGGHGFRSDPNRNDGSITLTQGWHRFQARFEEQTGGDGIAVGWKTPSGSWELIPGKYFRPLISNLSSTDHYPTFWHVDDLNSTSDAIRFTAQGDYIKIGNNDFNLPLEKTLSIWIKSDRPLSTTDNWEIGFLNTGSTQGSMFGFMYGVGNCQDLGFWGYGSNYDMSVESATNKWSSDGNWHNGVITMDSSRNVRVYVDGEPKQWLKHSDYSTLVDYVTMPINTTNNFVINSRGAWNSGFSYVELGQVLVYNRALSANEIKNNFEAHRNRYGV